VETVSIESPTASSNVTLRSDVSGTTVSFDESAAKVWAAVPAAYRALGIPLQSVDDNGRSAQGSVLAYRQFLRSPVSRFVDCGTTLVGPSADTYHVQIQIESSVDSLTPSTSRLHTRVDATGAGSGTTVRCSTSGSVERLIADQVKELVAEPR
jgi:hypothetical protein